jgi:hypothetical protein
VLPSRTGERLVFAVGAIVVAPSSLYASLFTPLSHPSLYMRVSICRSCACLTTTRKRSIGKKEMMSFQMQWFEILDARVLRRGVFPQKLETEEPVRPAIKYD